MLRRRVACCIFQCQGEIQVSVVGSRITTRCCRRTCEKGSEGGGGGCTLSLLFAPTTPLPDGRAPNPDLDFKHRRMRWPFAAEHAIARRSAKAGLCEFLQGRFRIVDVFTVAELVQAGVTRQTADCLSAAVQVDGAYEGLKGA